MEGTHGVKFTHFIIPQYKPSKVVTKTSVAMDLLKNCELQPFVFVFFNFVIYKNWQFFSNKIAKLVQFTLEKKIKAFPKLLLQKMIKFVTTKTFTIIYPKFS